MRPWERVSVRCARLPVLVCLWFLPVGAGLGQTRTTTANDLIKFLTYQVDRPGRLEFLMGLSSGCPDHHEDRAAAISLVGLGIPALPEIGSALDSMEESGPQSPFSVNGRWLAYAYARIAGKGALPRLLGMLTAPQLRTLGIDLDTSVALSLGLTSYVSMFHTPPALQMTDGRSFFCRTQEPRDALSQMILALFSDDWPRLKASLGPTASDALGPVTPPTTWAVIKPEMARIAPAAGRAVGYRFDTPGRWSEPEEALEAGTTQKRAPLAQAVEIKTLFMSRSGADCGVRAVKFVPIQDHGILQHWSIDNGDVADIIKLIAVCASQN
jgi:hypothetical protein